MRELTEEELSLAPEWAVKFDFFSDRLVFMSDALETTNQTSTFRFIEIDSGDYWVGNDGDYDLCTRLIVKEPFDITKHEWSDGDLSFDFIDGDGDIILDCLGDCGGLFISKKDAIAIAKHFGLTAEDLK